MVNPYNITNFNRSNAELEEFLLFCIVVAGKTAYIQAQKLDEFLNSVNNRLMMPEHINPFQTIKSADQHGILMEEIQKAKLGQYKKIFNAFKYLIENKIDLKKSMPSQLEQIPGVGMKTSRFFLLHSNEELGQMMCILDTHILKFIRANIDDRAPKSTPMNPKAYFYWENLFLNYCHQNNINDIAKFDLEIWKNYATKNKEVSE